MLGHVKSAEYPRRCSPGLHDMKWSYHAPQSGSRNVDSIRVDHVYAHPHRISSVHFGRAGSCSGWCPPAGTAGATTPPSSGLTRRWASWRLRCSCCDSAPSSRTARSGRRCMLLLPAGNHLKLPSCGADSRDLALCWRTPVAPAAGCWWFVNLHIIWVFMACRLAWRPRWRKSGGKPLDPCRRGPPAVGGRARRHRGRTIQQSTHISRRRRHGHLL